MGRYSEKRLNEIYAAYKDLGVDGAARKFGVRRETIKRRVREAKQSFGESEDPGVDPKLLKQLSERFTDYELKAILASGAHKPQGAAPVHNFSGDVIRIGAFTDLHLGSVYSNPDWVYEAFDVFADAGVDFITVAGDVHEGVSNRAEHVYECTHYGYSAQLDHSKEVFSRWTDTDVYMIDGNHDRWFIKACGAKIVDALCSEQSNLHFLGHDEGDLLLKSRGHKTPTKIKLWHGEDGSSYAFSYRVQKIVESFTGGEKPHVLICGHTHKEISMMCRHVHCVSNGSMQKQSKWMRSKRHECHTGFHVIELAVNEGGVAWFQPRFYPFYQ